MDNLQKEKFSGLLDRFHSFYDGVIRSWHFFFGLPGEGLKFQVVISTRDKSTTDNNGWANVVFEIEQVSEYRLQDRPKHRHQVLSNGIHFGEYDGNIFIDVGSLLDDPDGLEEFRTSEWYVAGRLLNYDVKAYSAT